MIGYKLYKHDSSKEFVCFVHGAGGSSSIWSPQIRMFVKKYNVLLVDLRGHGSSRSLKIANGKNFNFDVIVEDIIEVLEHCKIPKCHFIGISLGTIIIRYLANKHPERVQSMILAGAVLKFSAKSKLLMRLGNLTKSFIPHILLYKVLATIIIPKNAYKNSRLLFINEAKKVYRGEFIKWFSLTTKLKPILYFFREKEHTAPTLYIMGQHDRFFLPGIKSVIKHHKRSKLAVIKNSGHVVNIDSPIEFNITTINFISNLSGGGK